MTTRFEAKEMKQLINAVYEISQQLSPEKIQSIASKINQATIKITVGELSGLVSTQVAFRSLSELVEAWKNTKVNAGELAAMLLASSNAIKQIAAEQSIDLVWTGPTTPFVSTRLTEQALLDVITAAQKELFITSFVTYDVAIILNSLNEACNRGVVVSILLELSHDQGGKVSIDGIGRMKTIVPQALLYSWQDKTDVFINGSVHAKVAVADEHICFITSANLTGNAMEKNMEAGVLITGGEIPKLMHNHLRSLVDVKIISQA